MKDENGTSKKEQQLQAFARWLEQEGKSENTVKTYTGVLSRFLEQASANPDQMQSSHIQQYIESLEQANMSAGTIEKHYMAIAVFFKYIRKPEVMPGMDPKYQNTDKEKMPETLSPEEQQQLLQQVQAEENLRNVSMVYLMLHTGIRVSELCSLDCTDLHLEGEQKYIEVRDAKGRVDRCIPLSAEAESRLAAYLAEKADQSGPLFISSYNQRMTARSVQYLLKKYNVHPHKLRHTFCRRLIDKGVDLQTVSKLAGHKDLNMTKRYLPKVTEDLDKAINKAFM